MPRAAWIAVAVLATGLANPAFAQPLAPVGGPPLSSTPVTPSRTSSERPPPVLGAPVGVADAAPRTSSVVPSGFVDAPRPQRSAAFGAPTAAPSAGTPFPAQPAAPVPAAVVDAAVSRTAYNPPPADPVNAFLSKRSELKEREPTPRPSSTGWPKFDVSKFGEGWGEKLEGVFGEKNGGWFRSDHMFDGFISPVTNPFLFEDPRSLTELRPIFIYQRIPTKQQDFLGGNISFFGTQARVAFTDRWSLVVNKLGGISLNPSDRSPFGDNVGFAELWLGPKWTFYRGEENGAVAAGGLQFQLPIGSADTFQDTGSLSLVPYLSYGQNFLRDFQWGSFNVMASTGYAFSTSKARSDYYYLSAHLDFDVGNFHRFYPLVELNWVLNTTDGNTVPIGSEGRDLINFGAQASGKGLLTAAFGGRVKISESAQLGGAFEFPMAGAKDLFRYRFTLDFILRY
jgi:hypothetical protein